MKKHFTHLKDHTRAEIMALVDQAIALKKNPPADRPLAGKSLAFCFMNPSLRTQVSMETAAASLGAHPVVLFLGSDTWQVEFEDGVIMDGRGAEHLKDAVPVLSRYCQAVALRSFPSGSSWEADRVEPYLSAFKRHATVPVINLESASGHPCQALADLMTIKERMEPAGKNFLLTWAPHIKSLPLAVPSSAAEIAAVAGMNVTIARPAGFDLPDDVMARVRAHAASVKVTDAVPEAFDGQHVVYAKSWGSIANYNQPLPESLRSKWIVTQEKMARTDHGVFMHCLPVRRNLIVRDEVLDGPSSIVVDQAENRLHTAKAILLNLLQEKN